MAGRTVLLGWEMGGGFGYAVRLRTIALALRRAGHRPVLALRSLDHVPRMFGADDLPVVQAPWIIGRLTPHAAAHGFFPTGFADLMACNGFGSQDHLYGVVRAWRDLIDVVRPDLIVATHSPTLGVAAHGRVPLVLFGSAYATPPADGDTFPRFRHDIEPYGDQGRMLETVRVVQRRFGAPVPERITDVYRGQHRFVMSLSEADMYRGARNEPCAGIFETYAPPAAARGERIYAYLAGTGARAADTVHGLAMSGLAGDIHVRDAGEVELPPDSGLDLLPQPPELADATRAAAAIVHHGGLGTVHAALAAGRPQVLVPQVLDQWLVAEALDDLLFVMTVPPDAPPSTVGDMLKALLADDGARRAALDFARTIQSRWRHGAWSQVVDTCLRELA